MLAYPFGGNHFASTATAVLVVLGAARMWRRAPRRPLLLLLLAPLPATFLAAALGRYPYGTSARTSLYMAPAFCLLAGEGLAFLLRSFRELERGALALAGALGLVPLALAACDAARPYSRPGDVEFRQFARELAAQAAPGDRWVYFDGAQPLPRYPDLMLSIWVQRVAKLRFSLLSQAPVPLLYQPDPGSLEPSPSGRTFLIVHDHGFGPLYPRTHRENYEAILRYRLGASRTATRELAGGSKVTVSVFEAASPPH
jgi:hypothetical protein